MTSNPWLQKLTVVAVHQNHAGGNVKAYVNVRLGQALEINGVKVVQQEGQRPYVRLPDVQSNSRWYPVLKSTDPLFQEALSAVVLAAFDVPEAQP